MQNKTQKALKKIIKQMKQVQKKIAADSQPISMHELDQLTLLGQQYAKLVEQLSTENIHK